MLYLTCGNARNEVKNMFNPNLLKAKIIEKGMSIINVCTILGMCEATFYRKMARNGDFSRTEIEKISEVLGLTVSERNNIFFALKLA